MQFKQALLLMAGAATALLTSCASPSVKSDRPITLPAPTSTFTVSSTATPESKPEHSSALSTTSATATILVTATPFPALTAQDTLALVNGTLVDGTGAEAVPNASIVIRGDRIVAVGPRASVSIPASAQVLDVGGGTILPGLINAHVHFAFDEQKLEAWAQGGVTTVRDEGIISSRPITELLALRDATRKNPKYARLVSAGYMMTVPDGYGSLFVASTQDARRKVLWQLDAGVDMIKVSLEDGYAGKSGLPKLSQEQLKAIIAAAHERGTRVSGHITQARYLSDLVDAGVDDVAHNAYDVIPLDVLQRMVAKGIYLVPTFTVFRNYNAPVQTCVENLRRFVEQDGQVALGNDYGGGPGQFELGIPMYEIETMSKAGMTPMQIIVASTLNAAHVSHLENELGTLKPGKIADVLVVKGNPLQDLHALKDVQLVIHAGVVIRN
jgi:imidazolonepropionase-like amidohydrolase